MPDTGQYSLPYYTNLEFNLSTGQTDYEVAANQTAFDDEFSATLPYGFANKVVIRTDQTITVKLNSATNDGITVTSTDSPFTLAGVEIFNIFLSNSSGNTAAVKILLSKVSA